MTVRHSAAGIVCAGHDLRSPPHLGELAPGEGHALRSGRTYACGRFRVLSERTGDVPVPDGLLTLEPAETKQAIALDVEHRDGVRGGGEAAGQLARCQRMLASGNPTCHRLGEPSAAVTAVLDDGRRVLSFGEIDQQRRQSEESMCLRRQGEAAVLERLDVVEPDVARSPGPAFASAGVGELDAGVYYAVR